MLPKYNGTSPEYPFDEDFETVVLRYADNKKWYAIVMKISRRKLGFDSDKSIDVVKITLDFLHFLWYVVCYHKERM